MAAFAERLPADFTTAKGKTMTPFKLQRHVALLACCFAFAAAQAAPMSRQEQAAEKSRIEADYKAKRDTCKSLAGNAKDVCVEEAKGSEKIERAELDYRQSATASNQEKVTKARADAGYAVAKEKCDDLAGNPKDVCIKEAKAAQTRALADAKAAHKTSDARSDASDDKRDAQYKAEAEKCDALAGDAKSGCIANAKARYGKS
jgi:hypothetical protein